MRTLEESRASQAYIVHGRLGSKAEQLAYYGRRWEPCKHVAPATNRETTPARRSARVSNRADGQKFKATTKHLAKQLSKKVNTASWLESLLNAHRCRSRHVFDRKTSRVPNVGRKGSRGKQR